MNSMYFWPNNTNRICAVDTQVKAYFLYVRFHLKWKIHASQDLYSFVQFITKDMAVATKKNNNNNNRPTERLKYSIFHTRNWSTKNGNHMKFGVVFILLCVSWWQKIYMNDMKKTIVLNFCISMWHVCFIFPSLQKCFIF